MFFLLQYFGIIWLTVVQLSTPYVLFAANLDDFRSIAKQFVPEHLAEQIARTAAANIDEIVEKVKDKLKKDFNLREELQKKDSYDQDETKEAKYVNKNNKHSKFPTKDIYHDSRQEADWSEEYGDMNTETITKMSEIGQVTENDKVYQKFENNDGIYKTVDVMKINDSYEEYVIPKKDDIYESEDQTKQIMKITCEKPKIVSKIALKTPKEPIRAENYYELNEEELKAKTDSLWYEDVTTDTTINTETPKANVFKKTKKSRSGTMIPKRDFYKMSSPNYYAKLPNVAESYKFDEPIPVDDQEPENLKPIGNPPASINKKVKLI
ncbi:hypothetical protein K1T71_015155 [Dendrolimus kikuchii]|nr:hypothetical protein K1T71_015155 [Dendrolimus kikuchii]